MRRTAVTIAMLLAAVPAAVAAPTLLDAVSGADHATAMRLISLKGTDVNAKAADGSTALMYAAANGDVELVRALLKVGADPKAESQLGTSAITEAAIIGNAPILEALLKAGANPNFATPNGETPLMAAARSGKLDAAKALVDAGADVNAKENWGGQSPIMWAAALSQADMVKYLAGKLVEKNGVASLNEHGMVHQWPRKVIQEPRPKDLNKGGFTALYYAAREGCVACVANLLAAGADPDSEDPDRMTPLLLAIMNFHFDAAAVLINGGADLNKWDLFGRSPIYMAADVSTLPLKGNGAEAVLPSMDKLTALDIAKMMLDKGADPNIQLKRRPPYRDVPQDRGGDNMLSQGATPMLRAARAGDDKFVALLIQYKALVDLPNKDGITPLMAAAGVDFGNRVTRGRNRTEAGVLASMDLLIKAGANVNAHDFSDRNAGFGRGGRGGPGGAPPAAGARGGAAGARGGGAGRGPGGAGRGPGGARGGAVAARGDAPGGAGAGAARGGRGSEGGPAPAADSASARIAQTFRRGSQMPSANSVPNQTPLHGAAEHGFDSFIQFLVAHGADLNAKDAAGRTPLDVARGAGGARGGPDAFPKTVALLESLMKEKGIAVPENPGQ